jgi:hypothetical protein
MMEEMESSHLDELLGQIFQISNFLIVPFIG